MTINIKKNNASIKQTYIVDKGNSSFFANSGKLSKFQDLVMQNANVTYRAKFKASNIINFLPFRKLLHIPSTEEKFYLYRNDEKIGCIYGLIEGLFKKKDVIEAFGYTFSCYSISKGKFEYLPIYIGNTQIALIETFMTAIDREYKHKIYLLDYYKEFDDLICLYTIYYSNLHYTDRLSLNGGTTISAAYSISKYNKMYDPEWQKINFPKENYFGKINLFEPED